MSQTVLVSFAYTNIVAEIIEVKEPHPPTFPGGALGAPGLAGRVLSGSASLRSTSGQILVSFDAIQRTASVTLTWSATSPRAVASSHATAPTRLGGAIRGRTKREQLVFPAAEGKARTHAYPRDSLEIDLDPMEERTLNRSDPETPKRSRLGPSSQPLRRLRVLFPARSAGDVVRADLVPRGRSDPASGNHSISSSFALILSRSPSQIAF